MDEFPFLPDAARAVLSDLLGESAELWLTVGFDGETRAHEEEQPGWNANFVHVYVRGRHLGYPFGRFTGRKADPHHDAPAPGVYIL